jgi:hypothetical protein
MQGGVFLRKTPLGIQVSVKTRIENAVVMDNYAGHETHAIQCRLLKRSRFRVHFTPASASWLHPAERWRAALIDKQIRRNSFRSTRELEAALRSPLDRHNAEPKLFV